MRLAPRLGVVALLAASLGACSTGPAPLAGSLREGHVAVTAVVETDAVAVTFTPDRPDLHLYAMELAVERTAGLGVATGVRVGGALSATGAATADRPVHDLRLAALEVAVPVYPEGPVTVRVPVRRGEGTASLWVSYAACSATECFAPVRDREVVLAPS